ncbi:hypothetical protein EBT16_05670 [bacterium]|nr:hypothetical protein [bacterium]
MAKLTQKEWIVLLDKSPRGPLSEEEIGELLSKGILRRIDLAFLVPETPGEGQAQWKFLWQFPEFDARQKAKDVPPPAAVLEKRQPKTEEQITGQIQENIPLDLQTITIDDLILRANSSPKREFVSSSLSDEKERFRFQVPLRGGTTSSVGVLSAVFAPQRRQPAK